MSYEFAPAQVAFFVEIYAFASEESKQHRICMRCKAICEVYSRSTNCFSSIALIVIIACLQQVCRCVTGNIAESEEICICSAYAISDILCSHIAYIFYAVWVPCSFQIPRPGERCFHTEFRARQTKIFMKWSVSFRNLDPHNSKFIAYDKQTDRRLRNTFFVIEARTQIV